MKLFQLSFSALLLRFYMVMAIIVIAGFSGAWWLSILALPVFFSGLMGIQFSRIKLSKRRYRPGRTDHHTNARQVSAHA